MKNSYSGSTEVEGDDDDHSTSIFNSSYIHHLKHMKDRHSHGSGNSNNNDENKSYNSNILGDHLRRTASKDHAGGERFSGSNSNSHHTRKTASSHSRSSRPPMAAVRHQASRLSSTTTSASSARRSVEDTYLQNMNRVSRGGYFHDPNDDAADWHQYETPEERLQQQLRLSQGSSKNSKRSARSSKSSRSSQSSGKNSIIKVVKKSVSTSDPSEETIAVFGAYGVTGNYFLQLALEAGYKVRALILPGMELDDLSGSEQLRLITGSFDEEQKVRRVVKNATYVVCLLNDCDKTLEQQKQQQSATTVSSKLDSFDTMPPVLYDTSTSTNNGSSASSGSIKKDGSSAAGSPTNPNGNFRFMQLLVPILEELDTCRVLLYQASAVARDDKGATPIFGKVVKKLAVKKNVRQALREQDRIVKYITKSTKETSMNFIVTRPSSDPLIWDRPSRKKLAASKSQPGPFPITNIDLAEFTLGALREKKLFNSCPYVVQDGV